MIFKSNKRKYFLAFIIVILSGGVANILKESADVDRACRLLVPGTPTGKIQELIMSAGNVNWSGRYFKDEGKENSWHTVICAASTMCEHQCKIVVDDKVITNNLTLDQEFKKPSIRD